MKRWLLVLALLAVSAFPALAADEARGNTLSAREGRYVFGQTSQMRQDQFMLDTKTGRLWQLVQEANTKTMLLVPVKYGKDNKLYDDPHQIPESR